jgi:hypothetical protein
MARCLVLGWGGVAVREDFLLGKVESPSSQRADSSPVTEQATGQSEIGQWYKVQNHPNPQMK